MKKLNFILSIILFICAICVLYSLLNDKNAWYFITGYWFFNSIKLGIDVFKTKQS